MEANGEHHPPQPSLASTLAERRREVHVQRLRSLAQSNPRLVAAVVQKWLREDGR